MRTFRTLMLILPLVSFFTSCEIVNPEEKTPVYIHVDSFQFQPTPNTGTSSHKISSVWAYLDNQPLGVFDLPADIPVLTDKPGKLIVLPGVNYSGMNDVHVAYPFYEGDTLDFEPVPGSIIPFQPVTQYYPASLLKILHEDFETGNGFLNLGGDSLKRTSKPEYVFEGGYGGVIELNNSNYSESLLSQGFTSSSQSSVSRLQAYIELNYKGTLGFEIGLQTIENGASVVMYLFGFRPRGEWGKVYIGLQDFLARYPDKMYRVLVRVYQNENTNGYVALDNVKVVTRK